MKYQANIRPDTVRELTGNEIDNVAGGTLAGPLQPVVDGAGGAAVSVANGVAAAGNGIINSVDKAFT